MTTHVWVLAVALGVTALLNWGAVLRGEYEAERITRPTFVVLVLGLAWSLHTDGGAAGAPVALPLFTALGLSLLGDLFLLTATTVRYRIGLVVVLLAHGALGWAVLELRARPGFPWAVVPVALALLVVQGRVGKYVVRFAGRDRGLVLLSLLVLDALVVAAGLRGDWTVLGAAALLLVSHLVLGHDRFVRARRLGPVLAVATYHAALVLMVVGLLR